MPLSDFSLTKSWKISSIEMYSFFIRTIPLSCILYHMCACAHRKKIVLGIRTPSQHLFVTGDFFHKW